MLIAYRIALAIMGLSALYAGVLNLLLGSGVLAEYYKVVLAEPDAIHAVDTQSRILAGMWAAMGIFVLYAIRDFDRHIVALYFVFLGFALSGIGEFYTAVLAGQMMDALPKVLVQVGIPAGLALWGRFAAKKLSGA